MWGNGPILTVADVDQFLSCVSMPTHAERDIVLPILSVCPSV